MDEPSSNRQSAYHVGRVSSLSDIDQDLYDAMRLYLIDDLGLSEEVARARAEQEQHRKIAVSVATSLAAAGIRLDGVKALDLGAGLGAMSEELVLRGADVVSLEPGANWARLTRRRVERHGGRFRLVEAFGEDIPLAPASVDLVVSLQVLEHVKDPAKVLGEAWRVLRPGGHFYLACENYLAFREAHYQVPWLPLLPKPLGRLYLKAIGRSPKFLDEAITYTTYPQVLRDCRRLGFIRHRDEEMAEGLRTKTGAKWDLLRVVARLAGAKAPAAIDRARHTFKFGIYELFRKPGG